MSVEPRIAPGSCPLCPLDQGDTMGGAESKPYPFSTCFASPFMPLHPTVYARMLGEKMRRHNARVWLINTGWTGGAPGTGKRIPLPLTRRMVDAALHGELDAATTRRDRSSNSKFRARSKVCRRRSPSRARPGATRTPTITPPGKLADMFVENFLQFAEEAGLEIAAASPRGAENR